MAEPVSFAEHSCWNDEDFRFSRKPVVFRLFNVGASLGRVVNVDFTADYGIWYDRDDTVLMHYLYKHAPEVDWGRHVFYRKWDHSCIEIFDATSEEVVARVEVRGLFDRRPTDDRDDLGSNVVRMADYKARRLSEREHCPRDEELILELTDVYVPDPG